jgi:hypothetical protein
MQARSLVAVSLCALWTTAARAQCRFDWPLPSRVTVVKDEEKRGKTAKMRYRLTLAAGEKKGELALRQGEIEFLTLEGRDAQTPAMKKALAPGLALAQAIPDTIVDAQGHYLRIADPEVMLERFVRYVASQRDVTSEQEQKMRRTLTSPAMLQITQQACSADWNTWVGAWVGCELAENAQETHDVEVPFYAAVLPGTATRTHGGPVKEHEGCVRLTLTTVIEGAKATAAFAEVMEKLAKESGGKPFAKEPLEELRIVSVESVVTDPRTLVPRQASRTKTMRLKMKGDGAREQSEHAEWRFEWDAPAAPK